MKFKFIPPTININGTSKPELLEQLALVMDGLTTAEDAMCRAYPHGRDYPIGKCEQARDEWDKARLILLKLKEAINALYTDLYFQGRD